MKLPVWFRQLDASDMAERGVLAIVLGIAATASYLHLREVWQATGAPIDLVGPLCVDGLFAAGWLRMRRRRLARSPVGWMAWLALGGALAATLAGNITDAYPDWLHAHRDQIAWLVYAWPAIAFALVFELITGHGRAPRQTIASHATPLGEAGDPPKDLTETWEAKRARLLGMGVGRKRLAAELDITEHAARLLLEARATEQEELA